MQPGFPQHHHGTAVINLCHLLIAETVGFSELDQSCLLRLGFCSVLLLLWDRLQDCSLFALKLLLQIGVLLLLLLLL